MITLKYPIVICTTPDRLDLLCVTLSSLATSLSKSRIDVIFNCGEYVETPFSKHVFASLSMYGNTLNIVNSESKGQANNRAKWLLDNYSEKVIFLDDDQIVPYDTLVLIESAQHNNDYDVIGFQQCDVLNTRGYPDYSNEPKDRKYKWDSERFPYLYYVWADYPKFIDYDFTLTLGIWSVKALYEKEVVSMWSNWELGRRGYDVYGSSKLKCSLLVGTNTFHLGIYDNSKWRKENDFQFNSK